MGSTFLKDFYRGGRGTLQELITETGWGTPPRGGSAVARNLAPRKPGSRSKEKEPKLWPSKNPLRQAYSGKKTKKNLASSCPKRTLIRNQAELSLLEWGKKWENSEKGKNEKEFGRTDPRFGISRSNSPYPQIFGTSLGP